MNSESRRISTPTINVVELDKSLHQFRSLRLEKQSNILRSTSIILETSEAEPETIDLPKRPTSCDNIKLHTYNKSLSRNSSRHSSKKSINHEHRKSNSLNSLNVPDLEKNLNRTISTSTNNVIVREQYCTCCLKKWTKCERILMIIVGCLIFLVLALVIVIGVAARNQNKMFFM